MCARAIDGDFYQCHQLRVMGCSSYFILVYIYIASAHLVSINSLFNSKNSFAALKTTRSKNRSNKILRSQGIYNNLWFPSLYHLVLSLVSSETERWQPVTFTAANFVASAGSVRAARAACCF